LADNSEVGRRFLIYNGRQTERGRRYGRTIADVDGVDDRGRRVRVVGTQDTDGQKTDEA